MPHELLQVRHLTMHFPPLSRKDQREGLWIHALDDVSMHLQEGESVGIVGESGCGKSTLGRCILRLYDPTEGEILFRGADITRLDRKALLPYRRNMQMIFQDPWSSLNPRKTVLQAVMDPLNSFQIGQREARREQAEAFLQGIGLGPEQWGKYPHEMSGGQRQRIAIARAMIAQPALVVCDEPVSALDASIRAQILNLMKEMQIRTGVAYLFISHDLSVVEFLCTRIVVMYLGQIVESGSTEEIYRHPLHPYTQALLSAIPVPEVDGRSSRMLLSGDVPSPMRPPEGCRFQTRCPRAGACKWKNQPVMPVQVSDTHTVACHVYQEKE